VHLFFFLYLPPPTQPIAIVRYHSDIVYQALLMDHVVFYLSLSIRRESEHEVASFAATGAACIMLDYGSGGENADLIKVQIIIPAGQTIS
jgi:hypothetical protein